MKSYSLRRINPSFVFVAIFIAGMMLRCWRLTFVTLWSDEFRGTYQLIQLPWKDLLTANYSWEFNPPLYFILLKAWVSIFGSGEIVMRVFSIVLSSGSLVTIYYISKKLGDWRSGIAAMSILAFHPQYLYYSTELRMYSLLIFLSLVAILSYLQYTLNQSSSGWWLLLLGLSLILVLYTHYFGVFTVLGIFVFSICFLIMKNDRRQVLLFKLIPLYFIFLLPIIPIFLQQSTRYVNNNLNLSLNFQNLNITSVLAIMSGSVTLDFQINNITQVISLLSMIVGAVVLFRNHKKNYAVAIISFIGISSFATLIISLTNINIQPRYLILVYLMSWILSSLALIKTDDSFSKYIQIIVIIAIAFNSFVGISNTLIKEYPHPDWRAIAHTLSLQAEVNEPIVIMGWDAAPTGYYLNRAWLTSYDFEKDLKENGAASYLLLISENGRKLDFVDYSTNIIYEQPNWKVKIIRYYSPGK
jgi:uncharacterized membrane protein